MSGCCCHRWMLGVLVFTVLWALLMMALWFAPALVMLHDVAPLDAMKLSARACMHNLLAFLVLLQSIIAAYVYRHILD